MKRLITSLLIFTFIFQNNERRILSHEPFMKSFFCLSQVPLRYLKTPTQLEETSITFEIIFIQLSFQQYFKLLKVDVTEFSLYSTTFEVGDVFRYTLPGMSSFETFLLLFESNSMVDIYATTDTKKFMYDGNDLEMHRNFVEESAASKQKLNKITTFYQLGIWLRTHEAKKSMFERSLNLTIKYNTPTRLKNIELSYINTPCKNYEKKFVPIQKTLNKEIEKKENKGMTGLLYQSYFQKAFEDIQDFFEEDTSLFFSELVDFNLGELTSVDLPYGHMNIKEVQPFSIGNVEIKNSNRRFCWNIVVTLVSVLIVGGIVVGVSSSK